MATTQPMSLATRLREEITQTGPISFHNYMTRCLYDAEGGFYAQLAPTVGRNGHFVTNVSVGPVFGQLMADVIASWWVAMQCPSPFFVTEAASDTGLWARDVIQTMIADYSTCAEALRFTIIEPLPSLQAAQEATLVPFLEKISWVSKVADIPCSHVFFANELLDAFPVHRARWDGQQWQELYVDVSPDDGTFFSTIGPWTSEEARARLASHATDVPYPVGYTTEVSSTIGPWLTQLSQRMAESSRICLCDYGRPAADYYAAHRTDGTLRGYYQQRRHDDPYTAPGMVDLTADVDFTLVEEIFAHQQRAPMKTIRQELFLVEAARPRLLQMEKGQAMKHPSTEAWKRQFMTLVQPGHFGNSFHFLVS